MLKERGTDERIKTLSRVRFMTPSPLEQMPTITPPLQYPIPLYFSLDENPKSPNAEHTSTTGNLSETPAATLPLFPVPLNHHQTKRQPLRQPPKIKPNQTQSG
jgi:hypothetical protein